MIRIANVLHDSEVNGPGIRTVVWLQGCTLKCKGCCNKELWPNKGGELWDEAGLVRQLVRDAAEGTEGITLTGGEPLQQAEAVSTLLNCLSVMRPEWSVVLFTGYEEREIFRDPPVLAYMPGGKVVLRALGDHVLPLDAARLVLQCDMVVSGRYVQRKRCHARWRSSSNQKILWRTARYSHLRYREAADEVMEAEIHIGPDGSLVKTGYAGEELSL